MEFETLIVEAGQGYVAEITLNRPKNLNTFNSPMAEELSRALLQLDADKDVRVVLVKGSGDAFCAGIDVNELGDQTATEYRHWIDRMERPLVTISRMCKPVIAQVHGLAVANGMGLVAAADLAIVGENARMGLTAINVGLNCVGPVIPVARSVGRKRAMELLLYGNLISAQEALNWNLVNRVVPESELKTEARRWAESLAQRSPLAIQNAKSAFYNAEDMAYERQFAYMNEAFARLCTTADAKEGVSAFLNRRPPVWEEA